MAGCALDFTGVSMEAILKLFGEYFFKFCKMSGYDRMLRTLGGNLTEFIENLDALHSYLALSYQVRPSGPALGDPEKKQILSNSGPSPPSLQRRAGGRQLLLSRLLHCRILGPQCKSSHGKEKENKYLLATFINCLAKKREGRGTVFVMGDGLFSRAELNPRGLELNPGD